MSRTTPLALSLFLVLVARASAEPAAAPAPGPRTVAVAGTAVTRTLPDTVVWSITLSDADKDLRQAKKSSDRKLERVMSLRDDLDLKEGEIETGTLSVRREYEQDERGGRGAFKQFVITRSVTLRQRDLKRFDEFFDRLVGSADMEVSFAFESSREAEVRAETRLRAVRAARDKARAMAEAAGAKLGKVLVLDDGASGSGYSNGLSLLGGQRNAISLDEGGPRFADVSAGSFAPGAIEVRVTVHLVAELE